jgi:hypothetical protein
MTAHRKNSHRRHSLSIMSIYRHRKLLWRGTWNPRSHPPRRKRSHPMNDGFLGLAHSLPAPVPHAVYRWTSIWEPKIILSAKQRREDDLAPRAHHRAVYYSRIRALLLAHVSWKAIEAGELDDPRIDSDQFQKMFQLAVERRRARLGRERGKRRERYVK